MQRQSVVNLKFYQICGNKFFGIYVCRNNVLYILTSFMLPRELEV